MCEFFASTNPTKMFTKEHERDEYDKAYIVMQRFAERADIMSNAAAIQGFLDCFINEHRTSQQSIVRNIYKMLVMWSDGEHAMLVDARNQAAWDFARQLYSINPHGFPLI